MVAKRGERVGEGGRLGDHYVTRSQVHAAREVDGLKCPGAHQHVTRLRCDGAVARGRRDDVPKLGLTLGDAVAERLRTLTADHGRREIVRAHEIERLARWRSDREGHGVARLSRDDPDGLVDERTEDLMLVAAHAFRKRRDRAAAHRGKDLDGAFVSEIRPVEEPRVLAVDEDVHEATELAIAQHPRGELGVTVRDLARKLREIGDVEVERRVTAGGRAQRCGEADGDGHASTSAYTARNSSASAATGGSSDAAASVPL